MALSLKQVRFIKEYMKDGNASAASLRAGYKTEHAGRENLQKPAIIAEIERLKKEEGLTDELLLAKHKELLNAKKVQSCTVLVKKDKDGKTQVVENSDNYVEVEDNQAQNFALKLAYKINGKLIDKMSVEGEVSHKHFFNEAVKKAKKLRDG